MKYDVFRTGTALVTLHGGSKTTACDDARSELAATLESLTTAEKLDEWEITGSSVHEHPTGPFEPYTIAVSFRVGVTVEADETARAKGLGSDAIDRALASAEVEPVSYTSSATVSAA